jgi:hypothetical protein
MKSSQLPDLRGDATRPRIRFGPVEALSTVRDFCFIPTFLSHKTPRNATKNKLQVEFGNALQKAKNRKKN